MPALTLPFTRVPAPADADIVESVKLPFSSASRGPNLVTEPPTFIALAPASAFTPRKLPLSRGSSAPAPMPAFACRATYRRIARSRSRPAKWSPFSRGPRHRWPNAQRRRSVATALGVFRIVIVAVYGRVLTLLRSLQYRPLILIIRNRSVVVFDNAKLIDFVFFVDRLEPQLAVSFQ